MRHLLDLNDLLEEELCQTYQAEKTLHLFLDELKARVEYGPLLDWINFYSVTVKRHKEMLRKVFYQLFLPIDKNRTYVIENIINEYRAAVERTANEVIREEELINALSHIIHYKIASYNTLHLHAKALKYWDEMIGLHIAVSEEKEMEANLSFISEKHNIFLNDWYAK
ncbi:MAG: ferritin-like metal-binding protein YciE [Cyclobacteriaceae bacterium]|jgi:ferritin-like metal-binding protein YciE